MTSSNRGPSLLAQSQIDSVFQITVFPINNECKMAGVLKCLIQFIQVYLDKFIDYIFGLYYGSKRQFITQPSNSIVLESATSLAKKIRNQELTSEAVVSAFIERIKQVNSTLNAVVDTCFETALEEARGIDRKISAGEIDEQVFNKKPFLGVPFTTKDSILCKGLKATFGIKCRKDVVAEEDAVVVASMKNAGGILIGVTNVPQLNLWQETTNTLFGTTNNPYNTTRNVGGSSGGEAAIIAACGSPISIASDIGGSIRIPAFMCGLFGHKPTHDLMSTKGMTFRTGKEGPTIVTAGTITKYAEDITPFLKVLLAENVTQLKLDEPVDLKDVKVYYIPECDDLKMSPISKEMKAVIFKTVNYFEQNYEKPEKLDLPDLRYGGRLWQNSMYKEGYLNIKRDLTNRTSELDTFLEIFKYVTCRSDYNIAVMFNLLNLLLPRPNESWAKKLTENLQSSIIAKLGTNGVLLYPSAPWSARYHYSCILRPFNFYLFAVWNALKLPVTQVPLGLDSEGLPVGIQVIAAPNQDHLCIAVAKELEKAFGGYVPPFKINGQ